MKMVECPLRIVVADDSLPIRERIVEMLQEVPGVSVVAETGDVSGTMAALRQLEPDLLILDVSMPGGSGLDVLDMIREECLLVSVLVLSNHSGPELVRHARQAGAAGVLNKSRDFRQAVDFVHELAMKA